VNSTITPFVSDFRTAMSDDSYRNVFSPLGETDFGSPASAVMFAMT
jgi:hypothetical protein